MVMKDENVIFETNMDQLSLSIGSQKSRVRFGDVDTIEMDSLETSVQVNRRDSQKGVNNKVSEGTGSLASEEDFFDDEYSEFKEFDATSEVSEPKRMDISGSGLHIIPEIILQSNHLVEELFADQNKLQENACRALSEFKKLRVLRVAGNHFKKFPEQLLEIPNLTVLDISKNYIETIPDNIFKLEKLEELRIDNNALVKLPNTLKNLKILKSLQVSNNNIVKLPDFMVAMRFNNVGEFPVHNKFENGKIFLKTEDPSSDLTPPLTKLSLKSNQLKGNIILGNFSFLTQLDISENFIEVLDLSALDRIESLQCCKNQIKELTVNGRALNSLIASNNNLSRLIVKPLPKNLRHVDVSYNHLTEVPDWLHGCHQLRSLYANNNNITTLPDNLFQSEKGSMHTIQLSCNQLSKLPAMPKRLLPLQELDLHCNYIEDLPENFFTACENLILLNVSNNKLVTLPIIDSNKIQLERLYATNNHLTDRVLDTLVGLSSLRILHLAYNRLTTFPESCISNWKDLEEIVLSGNKLQHLPDNLANLKQLRVLRLHSNQLQSTPMLSKTTTLRVLDLAHNQLDKINLVSLVPKKLQFLDLSSNLQLQVDAQQLQTCRSQRPMSLVDVSGKNRISLPTVPSLYLENTELEPPWKIGFSETPGNAAKLYISQLRLPGFCNTEGLFGIFDGESNNSLPNLLAKAIPKILLEERTIKETASDYMRYTLLAAHRELKQQGQKTGVCAAICHISREKISAENSLYHHAYASGGRKFILRVANVGESSVAIVRQNDVCKLTLGNSKTKIGCSSSYPLVVPDPEVAEIVLSDTDEYLILANKKLWDVMTPVDVAVEIKKEENVLLAAKRVQDVAQSYGADENLSIILIKFNNLGTDIDFLMRELRQTIRKKPTGGSVISGFCKCGCCCETNNSCCHSGANAQFMRQPSARSDRSSPSGQSDQASVNDTPKTPTPIRQPVDSSTIGISASKNLKGSDRKNLKNGIVRAVRARIEEEKDQGESDSVMSEEQFKCWEYMLEQNTQLLFDKELDTISKAFTKRNQNNLARKHVRSLSTSTPAISIPSNELNPNITNFTQFAAMLNIPQNNAVAVNQFNANQFNALNTPVELHQNIPFLSKQFGSARSFHPHSQTLFKPIRLTSGMHTTSRYPQQQQPINGGPNAAYFGSMQRLMPYNLEYDFTMMQEHPGMEELMDPDGNHMQRMQQYWGVATTEL